MKKAFSLILTLSLSAGLLAGCSGSGTEKRVVNVCSWGEYIDDSLIYQFEDETGIKVNYTTFDSNESMYAKLKSGAANYDVVIPSDYMVAKMIAEGMLAPLDYSNIPNSQNIDAVYRDPDYDPTNAYTCLLYTSPSPRDRG